MNSACVCRSFKQEITSLSRWGLQSKKVHFCKFYTDYKIGKITHGDYYISMLSNTTSSLGICWTDVVPDLSGFNCQWKASTCRLDQSSVNSQYFLTHCRVTSENSLSSQGLIQRIQQGFPWMSPLCMQNAHHGQHRSPNNSHTVSRFLWKSCTWLE